MPNAFAFSFAALIFLGLGLDQIANDGIYTLYLLRKGLDFLEYVIFWR